MKKVNNYFCEPVLEEEQKRLFESYFHFIAHKSELPSSGDFLCFTLFENEILLYKEDEEIICFDNICPHRGAPFLCGENEGCRVLTCPYHGWQYRDGKLVIPNKSRFKAEEIENVSLFSYRVEYCGDFIFFSRSPKQSLKEQLGEFFPFLEKISYSITRRRDMNRTPFASNWKLSLENALENYHVPSIHPHTLSPLGLSDGNVTYEGENSLWVSEITNAKAHKKLQRMKTFFKEENYYKENYFSLYLFPFSMISSTFGYSYAFQSFFPHTVEETRFYSRTYEVSSLLNTDPFYESVVRVNRQIFDEDIAVCNLLQKSLKKRNVSFVYSSQEERIVAFQKAYEECMGEKR